MKCNPIKRRRYGETQQWSWSKHKCVGAVWWGFQIWTGCSVVPLPLPRLQSQRMHAASHPLLWRSLDCCVPGDVRVFASVYTSPDEGAHQTLQKMFGHHTSPLWVTVINKPKQQGGSDCGVFAVCTRLAFGEDPLKIICQARMRDYLLKCFEENLTRFLYNIPCIICFLL